MKAYETYSSEVRVYKDRISGTTVRQLTGYLCHSFHTYFTNNGWWDQNRRLLFCSDRGNVANLFSIEIETGEISRLTDFQPGDRTQVYFVNDVNPKRPEVYFIRDRKLYALDLLTLEQSHLYDAPAGFLMSVGLCGAEGRYIYVVLTEDLSDRVYADLNASYVGMRETFEAKPDCRIRRAFQLQSNPCRPEQLIWASGKPSGCWLTTASP